MNDTMSGAANWGRWGKDDERGAANFASAERIRDAASSLVRSGKVYSLAIPLQASDVPVLPPRAAPQHFMRLDGGDYAAGLKRKGGFQTSDDYIALGTHATTHIDALAHVWYEDRLYNDFPANTVRSNGAKHCGIDKLVHLVGRGVLIDLCAHRKLPHLPSGEVITPAHIEDCAQGAGHRSARRRHPADPHRLDERVPRQGDPRGVLQDRARHRQGSRRVDRPHGLSRRSARTTGRSRRSRSRAMSRRRCIAA